MLRMDPAPDSATELAQRLLDAHTRFQVQQLRSGGFASLVAEEVDHALIAAEQFRLEQVVSRTDVVDVAVKYVAQFRLPGAIPELAGDIAMRVRTHRANDTALGEVVGRQHVDAVVGKIIEMQDVRARIADRLAENPSIQLWVTDLLHSLATGAVASNRRLAERIPGVASALSIGDRIAGGAVREADKIGRAAAERAARGILNRWRDAMAQPADDELVDTVMDVWDDAAARSVGELLDTVEDDDLIDLLAIGYEFWLDLRESPYLHAVIATGVDYFFDTYGGFTLAELLDEFGLGRDDLIEEAMRFAPRAIAALDEAGVLEALVRRRLAAFYDSAEARALLGG